MQGCCFIIRQTFLPCSNVFIYWHSRSPYHLLANPMFIEKPCTVQSLAVVVVVAAAAAAAVATDVR